LVWFALERRKGGEPYDAIQVFHQVTPNEAGLSQTITESLTKTDHRELKKGEKTGGAKGSNFQGELLTTAGV